MNSTASGFNLYCGTDFAYQVKCKKNFKNFEWPYATKSVEQADKKAGIFSNIRKMATNILAEPIDKVKFVLTHSGLHIEDINELGAKFITHRGEVSQGSYQYVSWATNNYKVIDDFRCNNWSLVSPFESEDVDVVDKYNYSFNEKDSNSIFFIQMPYGEVKPRLLTNKENPYLYTKLISSTKRSDGYKNPKKSWWKIERVFDDSD